MPETGISESSSSITIGAFLEEAAFLGAVTGAAVDVVVREVRDELVLGAGGAAVVEALLPFAVDVELGLGWESTAGAGAVAVVAAFIVVVFLGAAFAGPGLGAGVFAVEAAVAAAELLVDLLVVGALVAVGSVATDDAAVLALRGGIVK